MSTVRFGDNLKQLREERGLGLREASRLLGIASGSDSYLRDIESGKFIPNEEGLVRISKAYGIPIRKLTDWVVADRLVRETGERAPGVSWFMRSLDDLDERGQRQAISRLLDKLASRKQDGEPWPDEFQIRRSKGGK